MKNIDKAGKINNEGNHRLRRERIVKRLATVGLAGLLISVSSVPLALVEKEDYAKASLAIGIATSGAYLIARRAVPYRKIVDEYLEKQ